MPGSIATSHVAQAPRLPRAHSCARKLITFISHCHFSLSNICICRASYRVPAIAAAGMLSSILARSPSESVTRKAASDSASCFRVRAPITGTIPESLGQHPGDGQLRGRHASFGRQAIQRLDHFRFCSRLSPVKRGRWARKSLRPAGAEPLSSPRESTP